MVFLFFNLEIIIYFIFQDLNPLVHYENYKNLE